MTDLKEAMKDFWVEDEDLERMKKYLAKDLEDYRKSSREKYVEMNKDGKKVGLYMEELIRHILEANILIELWEELMFSTNQ